MPKDIRISGTRGNRLLRENFEGTRKRSRNPQGTLQYYEDLGTTTTPEQYKAWKESDTGQLSALSKAKKDVTDFSGRIGGVEGKLSKWKRKTGGNVATWAHNEWDKFKRKDPDIIKARVVNADGTVEGTYRVHRKLIDTFNKRGGKSFKDHSYDDDRRWTVRVPQKEAKLDKLLTGLEDQTYNSFIKEVTPQLEGAFDKGQKNYRKGKSALSEAKGKRDLALKDIETSEKARETIAGDRAKNFQTRLNTMKQLFGGLKIG